MQPASPSSAVNTSATPIQLALVFAVLFIAYQLPEGLGMRVLHSFPVLAVLMLSFLPIAWLCGRALGFRGLDAWYMGRTPGWGKLLAACFALAILAKAAALAIGASLGVYQVAALSDTTQWQAVMMAVLVTALSTFFPSVAEDIVTRGFLMRAFPGLSQRWLFIVASSALYVANHIYRLVNGPAEWAMLFCFGLAYAAALYYSRTLWAAIGLHWGWNFAGQFSDRILSVDAVSGMGPLVSSAAHLLMLAVLVLAARSRAKLQN